MKFKKTHLTLAELGRLFGKTTKEIGSRLKEIGLRNSAGKPSDLAYRLELVGYDNPGTWGWTHVWHAQGTPKRLIEEGWQPVLPPPSDLVEATKPIGPFTMQQARGISEIVGADGEACVWMLDHITANKVCKLMNAGHRLGVFSPPTPAVSSKVEAEVADPSFRPAFTIYERTGR